MLNDSVKNLIPLIKEYMSSQPILRAWLFGSCSRGEERADSDIDIPVNYDNSQEIVSLFI